MPNTVTQRRQAAGGPPQGGSPSPEHRSLGPFKDSDSVSIGGAPICRDNAYHRRRAGGHIRRSRWARCLLTRGDSKGGAVPKVPLPGALQRHLGDGGPSNRPRVLGHPLDRHCVPLFVVGSTSLRCPDPRGRRARACRCSVRGRPHATARPGVLRVRLEEARRSRGDEHDVRRAVPRALARSRRAKLGVYARGGADGMPARAQSGLDDDLDGFESARLIFRRVRASWRARCAFIDVVAPCSVRASR